MRRIKAAIYTFLFVVSIVAMLGHDLRPIHADEITAVDPNQLAFVIETVDKQGVDTSTSIALDSNDHPHISYYKSVFVNGFSSRDLRYARYNGSSWIFETVDSDVGYVAQCSLDLDPNGYPHISYSVENISENVIFLKYAYFDGGSWIIQIVDSKGKCCKPSIAVDSRNDPHISYFEGKSKTLKYAHYNGGSWVIQTVESYGSSAWSQSIALDSYDNPHIAYSEGPDSQVQRLKYAYYNGTSWNIETVDSENVGYFVSIALDSQNNPHISYRNSPRGLKYAYFDGASWNIQTVPGSEGDNVFDTSIVLDSKRNPHISYLNSTGAYSDRSLRYAYYNGVSWSVKTVDSEGNVGHANSIALDSRDYPYISYVYVYSFRGHDLRYARAGIPPIASFTYSPSEPIGGETVNFDASTSYDPDGTIVSYAWDFGDGTTIAEIDSITTHAYATAGNHTVALTVTDSDGFDGTTTQFITIVRLSSTISISLSSSTSYVGFKVGINGSLTCNEVGLSGAPIVLSYSVTGGDSWNDITLVDTASDGGYSAEWMPYATGNYLVRAIWSGNATYWETNTTVSLAVTPFKEQSVFSVTSNSTVSELAFNSTSRELSFTVTGPTGTTGYVNVYIAKTLVDNIADVKVYLDGDQLNYTATSLDDSWLLHFTYRHSTHTIAISLGLAPFIPPELITPLSLGILAVALTVATTLLIFKIRRGTPPTILNGVFKKSKSMEKTRAQSPSQAT